MFSLAVLLQIANVSFSILSICSAFRDENKPCFGHSYDNYRKNTITAETNPELTVCDKQKKVMFTTDLII